MNSFEKRLNFGIIVIDKPSGPTSFTISEYVRKSLNLRKTSHFGTLDPKVSGVLPIALGRACRLTGFFLGHDKEYVGILRTHKEVDINNLRDLIQEKFIGKIIQIPPRRSRVKRAPREREIKLFEILEKKDKDFLFRIRVEGGTYVRKVCSDLGNLIGGAHMLELRRIQAGIFHENESISLYDFEKYIEERNKGDFSFLEKVIIPAEESLKKIFKVVYVRDNCIKNLLTGKFIKKEDVLSEIPQEDRFIVFQNNTFIGVYKKINEGQFIGRPEFVFN
ncbi:MAG: RNA-guided pseudouridylation complex pseudouridine synthase subunit Cbf5 [Candidatus Pacearchaeota archaeon]